MALLSPTEATDTELVQRIIDGDHQAFAVLFEKYRLMVYRYCVLMVNQKDVAEDVYQESFLALFEHCSRGQMIKNVRGFLMTVARRRCLNLIRNTKYKVPLTSHHLEEMATAGDFEDTIDLESHIRQALARIPVQYREAFVFFEVEGYSYEEIAEFMEVSFNVVKNRIYRAKKVLQELLEPVWETTEKTEE